jgi:hypothetical protein
VVTLLDCANFLGAAGLLHLAFSHGATWLELNAALDEDFEQLHEAADGDETA